MTEAERTAKRRLNAERIKAVRLAWKDEVALVKQGKCSRQWSVKERRELLSKGRVNGYVGHHMRCVNSYPKYAGDRNNIQFLSNSEHIKAHSGCFKNRSNGYYNPETKSITMFTSNENPHKPVYALKTSKQNNHTELKGQKAGSANATKPVNKSDASRRKSCNSSQTNMLRGQKTGKANTRTSSNKATTAGRTNSISNKANLRSSHSH